MLFKKKEKQPQEDEKAKPVFKDQDGNLSHRFQARAADGVCFRQHDSGVPGASREATACIHVQLQTDQIRLQDRYPPHHQ